MLSCGLFGIWVVLGTGALGVCCSVFVGWLFTLVVVFCFVLCFVKLFGFVFGLWLIWLIETLVLSVLILLFGLLIVLGDLL